MLPRSALHAPEGTVTIFDLAFKKLVWDQQMSFTQAVSSGFRRYFDFRTRSSRSEYWWWTLFTILVSVVATIVDEVVFGGTAIADSISSLLLIIPGTAIAVRRLHDVNRSGWWILIAFTIVGIVFPLFYWSVQKGTQGTNKYGVDPLSAPPAMGFGDLEVDPIFQGHSGFCHNCGSAMEADANFCRVCGTAV